jgi:hypothetical protein
MKKEASGSDNTTGHLTHEERGIGVGARSWGVGGEAGGAGSLESAESLELAT